MNTNCLVVILCVLSFNQLFGRIKNGYESQLQSNTLSLRKLNLLLLEDKDMSFIQRLRIKSEIENLINDITCYELTEELIHQLKMISPDTYFEMESIKDKRGRATDVYVKLIPRGKSKVNLRAASFLSQASADEDANYSEYGELSVSVEICIDNNALYLLSHELGHLSYIVPNLATYAKFYEKQYANSKASGLIYIGHGRRDLSGKLASTFERRYVHDRAIYLENGGKKPEVFVSHFIRIKRTIGNLEVAPQPSVMVSNF